MGYSGAQSQESLPDLLLGVSPSRTTGSSGKAAGSGTEPVGRKTNRHKEPIRPHPDMEEKFPLKTGSGSVIVSL